MPILLIYIPFSPLASADSDYPELNIEQLNWLGEQIYNNECARQSTCLTAWNAGENFPSLGIGHFIWYQASQEEIFKESFPQLLAFLQTHSIELPQWIVDEDYNSPWKTRQNFLDDFNEPRLAELRVFLQQHMAQQTQFIVERFERAADQIITGASEADSAMLKSRFLAIANASPPFGLYALIDYVNFKGEGLSPQEKYQGQGWGLRQVLENMKSNSTAPLQQFVISAKEVLETRVQNSPKDRKEERWLLGWGNRLNTYLPN